jgi:hypothetical protein
VNNAIVLTGIERAREGGGFIMRKRMTIHLQEHMEKYNIRIICARRLFVQEGILHKRLWKSQGFCAKPA